MGHEKSKRRKQTDESALDAGGAAQEAKDSGKELGRSLTAGVSEGSAAAGEGLKRTVRSVLFDAVGAAKRALGIHSPSRVMRDEVGAQIVAGIADGIDQNGTLAERALEEVNGGILEAERRYLEEKERLDAENLQMQEENRRREYEKRLAAAKDAVSAEIITQNEILRRKKLSDEEYLNQLKTSAEVQKSVLNRLKDEIRVIYQDIAKYAQTGLEDTIRTQQKLEDKLSDYGSLTTREVFRGLGEDGGDLEYVILSDLRPQIEALQGYADALEEVRRRAVDRGFSQEAAQGFFAEMAELSIEDGTRLAQLLNNAGDAEFTEYLEQWIRKEELSEQLSKRLYMDQFTAAVDDTKEYMVKKLEEAGLEIPDGFFVSGSVSAENFGSAFLEEMEKQMDEVRRYAESFSFSFVPEPSQAAAAPAQGATYHNTTTYVLNSSGETVAQQLMSARSHDELERMRNG